MLGLILLLGAAPALAGFTDNGNGTVTDTSTGLTWQQATASGSYTWEQALAYCENLTLGSRSDWRLPTRKELRSIVDYSRYNPSINTDFFPNTIASWYWSSTTSAGSTDYAWGVPFYSGLDYDNDKSSSKYVRAVRGGQSGSFGDLVISASRISGEAPLPVDFSISFSGGPGPYTYDWDFGDGGTSTEQSSSHTYQETGTYVVTCSVTDSNGASISASQTIRVKIKEANADDADNLHLTVLEPYDAFFYGITGQNAYVSTDADSFVQLYEGTDPFNDICSSSHGIIFVGDNGAIIQIVSNNPSGVTIPGITADLLCIATDNAGNFILAGRSGTLASYDMTNQNYEVLVSPTAADIEDIIYDVSAGEYLAVTSMGELLRSDNGINWSIQSIGTVSFNSLVKNGDTIILAGNTGVIYTSTDGTFFNLAITNTTDDIVDLCRVGEVYVAATETMLLTSEDGLSWLADTEDFSETTIYDLCVHDNTLLVLTTDGIRSISRFNNETSGLVKTATLAGVDVEFGESTVEFENSEIKAFKIVANDFMLVKQNSQNIARIDFGADTEFVYYSKNTSTLASILDKDKEYICINGNNTLYYNTGNDNYIPVSEGSFWLKNGKVMEQNLLSEVHEDTRPLIETEINDYINTKYTQDYNALSATIQAVAPSPQMLSDTLAGLLDTVEESANFDIALTANYLLLGDIEKPFSPCAISSPFFRLLYLDTSDGKIYQKQTYLLGPTFFLDKTLPGVKLPKLEYVVDGNKLTGTITDFELKLGPFAIISEKARLISYFGNINDNDWIEEEDSISIDQAGFILKSTLENVRQLNSNQSVDFISKVKKLKLVHNYDGFKLVSGEAGAAIRIPNLNLSPNWAVENLYTYIFMKFREKSNGGPFIYDDDYPDELDEFLVGMGGSGSLRKRQFAGFNQNTDLKISAGIDLVFDDFTVFGVGDGKQNLMHASLAAQNWFNFPKAGAFTLTGVGGEYKYSKYGPSYWSLTADFKLYQVIRELYLFNGGAKITSDFGLDSFGLGLTYLKTPMLNTNLYIDWTNNNDLACLLFGQVRHDMPISCPDIVGCDGSSFDLMPADENTVFEGLGLGMLAGLTIREDATKNVWESYGARFEDLVTGALGVQVYGIDSQTSDDYDVSIKAFADVELRLPKINKDWFFIPESFKNGKSIGNACVSIGNFEVTQEYTQWFSDKECNLGVHPGVYLVSQFLAGKKVTTFIPFDYMEDKDGDHVPFVINMKVKSVDDPAPQSAFALKTGDIGRLSAIGESELKIFTVGPGEDLLIVDVVSSDNTMIVTMPDGTELTQDSPDTGTMMVEKVEGVYTEISIADPPAGVYGLSYINTGDEQIKIFGSNPLPAATLSVSGSTVSFSLNDADNELIKYSLAVVDANEKIVHYLKKDEQTAGGDLDAEIGTITHLQTGDYKVMLIYSDPVNPDQKLVSAETVHIEKSIAAPSNLAALSTTDYVELSWDADPGASGYHATISMQGQLIYEAKVAANRFKVTELIDGEYTAEVYGYDEDGLTGTHSDILFSVTSSGSNIIPDAIAGVTVTINADAAVITWPASANTDFYTIGLIKGIEAVYSEVKTIQPSLSVSKVHFGASMKISVISHNFANNASEVFTGRVDLYTSEDTDIDNLPDMWEMKHFYSLGYTDSDDVDLDGADNVQELAMATNPCDADSDRDRLNDSVDPYPLNNDDKNGNFIADDWEIYYNIIDIMADDDGDGYLNYLEYMASMNPIVPNAPGIDMTAYEQVDFMPVIVANVDQINMIRLNEPLTVDLSASFDINGDPLTYEWKVNSDGVANNSDQLVLDTSKTGMNRVEVKVADSSKTVYRKYSIFVTDGDTRKVTAGKDNIITLDRYELSITEAAMAEGTYLVAGDISFDHIPVNIMGRKIISDGLIYLYSGGAKLASPITITPYVKEYSEIAPYVFNYSTSIWTNLNTGETFDPIYKSKSLSSAASSLPSYAVNTKDTGILVFARAPQKVTLTPVSTFKTGNSVYQVDLDEFMTTHQLQEITEVTLSNSSVVSVNHGQVLGNEELRFDALAPGLTEVSITGAYEFGTLVSYKYIIDVQDSPGDLDTDGDDIDDDWELRYFGHIESDGSEDSDDDGVSDLAEYQQNINPNKTDSDEDGIQDGTELGYTLLDICPDTDIGVFLPDIDPSSTTDPEIADTDGDTFDDGFEDINHNGQIDVGEYDPNNPGSFPGMMGDIDGEMNLNLRDAVLALQIAAGLDVGQSIFLTADVNGDGKVGLEEAIYIMEKILGMRE
ncbi:MAG: DUF1566 domain-containing protein [Desulfobacteraceae bacterium]|nr:DUF1566 domain-containing protein [Desulfobacteraceae bacterium]